MNTIKRTPLDLVIVVVVGVLLAWLGIKWAGRTGGTRVLGLFVLAVLSYNLLTQHPFFTRELNKVNATSSNWVTKLSNWEVKANVQGS